MKCRNTALVAATALTSALPTLVYAQEIAQADKSEVGFYVSGQVGYSQQVNDSEAIGQNIAVDADFPAEFDAGDGVVGGFGLGYKFDENFRIEGRLSYREGSFSETQFGTGAREGQEYILDGDIQSTTLTVEGFYDFPNKTAFTPYIKVGVGVSDNSYSARLGGQGVAGFDAFDGAVDGYYDAYADGDATQFTWNVGFGGNYQITQKFSLYSEYQYASFGDINTGQDSFTDGFKIDDIASHEVVIGIKRLSMPNVETG